MQRFQKEEQAQEKKASEFSSSKAGVGGIMRSVTSKAKDADASMAEAFSDLSAMMEKAKEMVELAKRFETQMAKTQERNESEDEQFRGCAVSVIYSRALS